MAWPVEKNVAMGQLALAIAFEQLKLQQERGELTEQEVSDLLNRALAKFGPEYQPELRALLER